MKSAAKTTVTVKGIGYYHNEALAKVYDDLKSAGFLKPTEANALAKSSAYDYLKSNDFAKWDSSIDPVYSTIYDINYKADSISAASPVTLYKDYSPELKTELIKLEGVVDDYLDNGNIADLYDYAIDLKAKVPTTLKTTDDQQRWQNAVEVMGYSSAYWNDHILDWQALNPKYVATPASLQSKGWWSHLWQVVKPFVKADLEGAIEGGIDGLITGGPAGAGSGALGGAVAGSVGHALGWDE